MDRSTPEGEAEFRAQQKRDEVQQVLAEMPDTVDAFIASPKWTRNRSDNFVFRGQCPSVTIVINDRGINWYVPGGKHSWGPGGFATVEDAKRDLWGFLKSFEDQ